MAGTYELIPIHSNSLAKEALVSVTNDAKLRWYSKKPASWRFNTLAGVVIATLVLIANIVVAVWAHMAAGDNDGVATAFQGQKNTLCMSNNATDA